MDEMFLEQMVKRGTKEHDRTVRIIMVVSGVVICALPFMIDLMLSYYISPVMILAVALVVWILWRRTAKEYEYIFTDGSLDIDVVYSQSTRQHMATFDCRLCRMIVPADNKRYEHEIYDKKYDKTIYACAGKPDDKTYVILGKVGDKQYRVFFDPNEKLLNAIYQYSPKNTLLREKKIESETE